MKIVATPGFLEMADKHTEETARFAPTREACWVLFVATLRKKKPSWVIGVPGLPKPAREDEGRTLKIPAPFKFYAIRDDHEKGCDCGCGGQAIITFLLPEEY